MILLHYEYEQDTDQGAAGWSENFWFGSDSLPGALVAWNALAPLLAGVHSSQARLRGGSVRAVSNDPGAHIPRLFSPITYSDTGWSTLGRFDGMYPTTAVRISLYDAQGRSNDVWLKGMPDDADKLGHIATFPIWSQRLGALLLHLQSAPNNIVRRSLDLAQAKTEILSITATGVVTTRVAHGLTTGNVVRVGRTTTSPINIDGLWSITEIAGQPNQLQLNHFPQLAGSAITSKASYLQRQLYTAVPVTAAVQEGVTKKNVGRPRRGPRGRQKRAKS